MAVLGFDLSPLRDSLANLQESIRTGTQQGQQPAQGDQGGYLGYLNSLTPPPPMPAWQALGQVSQRVAPALSGGPASDFLGQLSAYAGQQGLASPAFDQLANLSRIGPSGFGPLGGSADNWAALSAYSNKLAETSTGIGKGAAAVAAVASGKAGGTGGGGPSVGLDPGVSQWADQTSQTFGDLGGWVPSAMLAIIQHESEGNPGAYNGASAGGAWGLFQQMGLGSNDPNAQFAAAKQLLQEKLTMINASYQRLGINPDERTRARDIFLAWAGQFDPNTAGPNNNRDEGNGQDAEAFLNGPRGIMPMYDNIVKGRQQAPTGGGGTGFAAITGGQPFPIMQGFGVTDYAEANPATYGYETQFGMQPGQHTGIDWAAPVGTRVYSPRGGTVVFAGGSGYYTDTMNNVDPAHSGEYMVQMDDGTQIILGHMSSISATVGQRVNPGDFVGLSGGSDGAHIHIEVRIPDKSTPSGYRIIDPVAYFGGR